VVDVDFDVADALPPELGEGGEQLVAVLLLRVEEAVAGPIACGVAGAASAMRGQRSVQRATRRLATSRETLPPRGS